MARDTKGEQGAVRLGVNIDHVATLRQARGTPYPDIVEAAWLCEKGGATGITIHLREDRRHIQDRDVYRLRKSVTTRLNLEMACHPDIVRIALDVRPDEVCLVPERRRELTTEGGLDVIGGKKRLASVAAALSAAGIVVSFFIDPDLRQVETCAAIGVPYVELHTGRFCDAAGVGARRELGRLIAAARHAHALGLKVNAGHGIHLGTVGAIMRIPYLDTLNIGHSIVCRAVFVGLKEATREMLVAMRKAGARS